MKINRWLTVAGMAAGLCLGISQALAQDQPAPGGAGAGGGGGRGARNFDPAQFRERMMERTRETLEITDDTEWKAIEPLVQKVMDTRMASMGGGMGRGMFGPPRRPSGDNGGGGDQPQRRGFMGQPPSPEGEALQKAIDAKAPKAEIKAALAKYVEARKAKQAELEKAQDELRKVLSSRQEAIATLNGLL
jgi:hypothetical protein